MLALTVSKEDTVPVFKHCSLPFQGHQPYFIGPLFSWWALAGLETPFLKLGSSGQLRFPGSRSILFLMLVVSDGIR